MTTKLGYGKINLVKLLIPSVTSAWSPLVLQPEAFTVTLNVKKQCKLFKWPSVSVPVFSGKAFTHIMAGHYTAAILLNKTVVLYIF